MRQDENPLAPDAVPDKARRIEHELAAIEQSPVFARSPVMRRLLRFIVTESRAGRGSQIKSYTLAVDGLGKPEDFDAQQDSYPRVQIGRLRKALELYYHDSRPVDGLRFELRPGGYEIHFIETENGSFAEPPAVQISAAPSRRFSLFSPERRKRHAVAGVFLLLCAVLLAPLFAGGFLVPWGANGVRAYSEIEDPPMVALQPVAPSPQDGVDANLADWLTSRITGALLGSEWVWVRPMDVALEAGAALPDYELRNRVFVRDKQLFLALEMVDVKAGMTIWTQTAPLEKDAGGAIVNIDDILAALVSQAIEPGGAITTRVMQGEHGDRPRPGYSCLLYVTNFWFDRTGNRFDVADKCVRRTLAINPRFAHAWGALAMLEYADNDFNYSGKGAGGDDRAWKAISTAVLLDTDSAFLRSIASYIDFRRADYAQASASALKAYALNPYSSRQLMRISNVLFFTRQRELGLKLSAKALAADPDPGPWFYQTLFFDAVANNRVAEAARLMAAMSSATKANGVVYSHIVKAVLFAMEGKAEAARQSWNQVVARIPQAATAPRSIFDRLGVSKPYADRAMLLLRRAGAIS